MTCFQKDPAAPPQLFMAEATDEGLVFLRGECWKGHHLDIWLQNERFELVLDQGLLAFGAGFTREAAMNFSTGWERLLEFYTKSVLLGQGVDWDLLETAWKHATKQSERQLGWFIGTYLSSERDKPPMLSPEAVSLRNKVVHQGYFPTRAEAKVFMEEVWQRSIGLRDIILNKHPHGMEAYLDARLRNGKTAGKPTMAGPSVIGLRVSPRPILTFDQAVAAAQEQYRIVG